MTYSRPQRDEVEDPWPLKALLGLALLPYFLLLTIARRLPRGLGGMDTPTHFPSLRVLALCWPLTALQAGLAGLFLPLLWWDYRARYLESIGERGKRLPHKPEEGVGHGVATWLFTRYIEQPLFKVDTLRPDEAMLRAAAATATGEKRRRFLLAELPYRQGRRPLIMQGLPQRQLTQLPPPEDTALLNDLVFDGYLKSMGQKVYVGQSLQEGTGALGARWTDERCCDDLKRTKQEFAHQHSLDKSWHLLLSPADAIEVLAKGWGERGPPQALMGMAPVGMMLLYAPRNKEERLVFLDILAASSRYCEDATTEEGKGWVRAQ